MGTRGEGDCETAGAACRAGLLEQVCRITAGNAKEFRFAKGLYAGTPIWAAYQRAARAKEEAAAAAAVAVDCGNVGLGGEWEQRVQIRVHETMTKTAAAPSSG